MNKAVLAALAATLLGGGIFAVQGCTVSTGSGNPNFDFNEAGANNNNGDDDSDASTTTDTDGGSGDTNCNSCLYGACSTQYTDCFANADCLAIYKCATNGSGMTSSACEALNPNGGCLYEQLSVCDNVSACATGTGAGACASSCPTLAANADECPATSDMPACTASTTADGGTVTTDDGGTSTVDAGSCEDCAAASCSAQQAACATGTTCDTYNQCVLACADATTCPMGCQTSNAAGYQAAQALSMCTATSCATSCQ